MKKRRRIKVMCVIFASLLFIILSAVLFIYCTPRGYRMTVALHGYTEIADKVWVDNGYLEHGDEVLDIYFDACSRVRSYYGEKTSSALFIVTENEDKLERMGGKHDIITFAVGEVYSYISISAEHLTVNVASHELMHAETHERLYSGKITLGRNIPAWFDEGVALQADHGSNYTWGKLMKHTENMKKLPDFKKLMDDDYFYNEDEAILQYNYIVSKFEVGRWIDESGGFDAVTELIEKIREGADFYDVYDFPYETD